MPVIILFIAPRKYFIIILVGDSIENQSLALQKFLNIDPVYIDCLGDLLWIHIAHLYESNTEWVCHSSSHRVWGLIQVTEWGEWTFCCYTSPLADQSLEPVWQSMLYLDIMKVPGPVIKSIGLDKSKITLIIRNI